MRSNATLLRAIAILAALAAGAVIAFAIVYALRPGPQNGVLPMDEAGEIRPAADGLGDGEPLEIRTTASDTDSVVLQPLTPVQLAIVHSALPPEVPDAPIPKAIPRVKLISQFDGGDFAGANCTMASGAMLAELAFGVRTTGTVLRNHQNDREGGTGLDDLQLALQNAVKGTIRIGNIGVQQLRKLSGAGYGVVLQGLYSHASKYTLQPSFRGGHAIYVDGFVPADAHHPGLYWVIDPIARQSSGYKGRWWTADVLEDFAAAWAGAGRVSAAWAPPLTGLGFTIPDDPDFLDLEPSGGNDPSEGRKPPRAGGDGGDDKVPEPKPIPGVVQDPGSQPSVGGQQQQPSLQACLVQPIHAGCPNGILAIYNVPGTASGISPPAVNVVFVDSDQPNVAFVGFTSDDVSRSNVFYWPADDPTAPIQEATSVSFVDLVDRPTWVARLEVLAGTKYQFMVMAVSTLGTSYSPIGSFTTGAGIREFEFEIVPATGIATIHDSLFSLYSETTPTELAMPFVQCTGSIAALASTCDVDGAANASCSTLASFGAASYCLPATQLKVPAITACPTAKVHYEITGLDVTSVEILAYPIVEGILPDKTPASQAAVLTTGPPGSADVQVGCLVHGLTYFATIDAIGDDLGPLYGVTLRP